MNCPHCFQPVMGQHTFCPHCGARVAEMDARMAPDITQDPMYGALAYANLLRLRGEWEAAREKTVSVMREYPNSGTALSLMGDIFADQQMNEDAAQWYRMALELEPENAADTLKLATVEGRLLPPDSTSEAALAAPPQFNIVRVAAVTAMLFLAFAIALGFYVKKTTVPLSDLGPSWVKRVPRRDVTAGAPPTSSSRPTEAPDLAASKAGDSLGTGGIASQTDRDYQLTAALRRSVPESFGSLDIAGAVVDPRDQSVVITIVADQMDRSALGWTTQLYTAAVGTAAGALNSDPTLTAATVRVVMPLATARGSVEDVVFIGDIRRSEASPFGAPSSEIGFKRQWWNPGVSPPPALVNKTP